MDTLNYHHLRYFREVAHDGQLTRTAERLNVSQSALSMQIKTLEERLGHALGQSGKDPYNGDAWARMYLGVDESTSKNYGYGNSDIS